jgi:hypothetical protein
VLDLAILIITIVAFIITATTTGTAELLHGIGSSPKLRVNSS